jgi:Na+-driven multidrug efflux pump/anti-sigma regulatory factor (Ser/Thr protein kinase)
MPVPHENLSSSEAVTGKLVNSYLFPSICALMGQRISSLANSIVLGHTLGSLGLSVASLVSPIALFYFSLGSLVGVGASVVSGAALGRGDRQLCAQVFTLACGASAALALLVTALGLANLDALVRLLGGMAETAPAIAAHTRAYARLYIAGGAGLLLLYIPLNYLRVTGRPRLAMTMLLLMSFLNVAGVIVFVALLGMGPAGMALSQALSACAACVFGFAWLFGPRNARGQTGAAASDVFLCLSAAPGAAQGSPPGRGFAPRLLARRMLAVMAAGSPSSLNNICRAAQSFCVNRLLVTSISGRYAAQAEAGAYLACWSVTSAVSDFALAIIFGVSQAALPLVGISFGEKDERSIILIMKKALIAGSAVMAAYAVLLLVFHNQVGMIFGVKDAALLRGAGRGVVFLACGLNFSLLNNLFINFFNATKRIALANTAVACRFVVFMVLPARLLFPVIGINAVWYSLIFTELATMGLLFLLTLCIHAGDRRLSRYTLLDERVFQDSAFIDFSVRNSTEDVDCAATNISGFCEENEFSPRTSAHVSHAIEEMLLLFNEFSLRKDKAGCIDLRILINQREEGKTIIMRIRCFGRRFNPVDYYYANRDTEAGREKTLGVAMILRMAEKVDYSETFGLNNLIITLEEAA